MTDVSHKLDIVSVYSRSGASAAALQRALKEGGALDHPNLTEAEILAVVEEAERKNVFGFDYKTDRNGNPIPVGVGSPGHENGNHFQAIRRYQGEAAYQQAVREIYKRDPQRAERLGLPRATA